MPFAKGQSGNPGGRPKHATISAAQALARLRLNRYIARLDKIVHRGADKEAVNAARLLLQVAGVPLSPESTTQPASQPPANSPFDIAQIDNVLAQRQRESTS